MKNVITEKFFKYVSQRLKSRKMNKNWLAVITGTTGSGKSYSSIGIAKMMSNKYHIVFNARDFLKLINSGTVKKGHIIIFDEAGVGMSNRDWYTIQNKVLGSVLQTFRHMNIGVIFTVPNMSFIDSQARKLFHHYFVTSHINYDTNMAILSVFGIKYNERIDKIYYIHPRVYINKILTILENVAIPKPSEEEIISYENMKNVYTKNLNREALKSIEEIEIPQVEKIRNDNEEIIKKVSENINDYLKEFRGKNIIVIERIQNNFNISYARARIIKDILSFRLKL